MDKSKTCFFTGHRKIAQSKIEIVKAQLAENIEKMITEYGVNTFIDGDESFWKESFIMNRMIPN